MRTPAGGRSPFWTTGWAQLAVGVLGMVAVTNLQYSWTLFVDPLTDRLQTTRASVQTAFTVFVVLQTWLVPVEGWLVDRFGPRLFVGIGGVLVGLSWLLLSVAQSMPMLYVAQALGGIGVGAVYGTCIGNALKWFPHHRGLAAGLTAGAYGTGSALTVFPITWAIREHGAEAALIWFGLAQGILVVLCAAVLRAPPPDRPPPISTKVEQTTRDFTPLQMLRTPAFWLMYLMFVMAATGGLMLVPQIAPLARDYQVADRTISFLGLTLVALPTALALDRVLNGLTRPFFGWVSDHLGRENTMFVAFGLEGLAILLLVTYAHDPILFVLLTGLTFFAWGEIYSLFPALSGDLFGRKYATVNYGLLYTAKGTAALFVPLGSQLQQLTGSWEPVFHVAIAFDWMAAILALVALKPLRRRWLAAGSTPPPA